MEIISAGVLSSAFVYVSWYSIGLGEMKDRTGSKAQLIIPHSV